jgi:hypothetical protein
MFIYAETVIRWYGQSCPYDCHFHRIPDNILFNLELSDDQELIRQGNALKHWEKSILNRVDKVFAPITISL